MSLAASMSGRYVSCHVILDLLRLHPPLQIVTLIIPPHLSRIIFARLKHASFLRFLIIEIGFPLLPSAGVLKVKLIWDKRICAIKR